ncbi:NADPH-dependent FMN reductase [Micromonospora sp. DT53]|uniref:NADPH-dependent FMN reductase n=1 Tax=Micromonospora sp. DT53 TaxID=3393444 RepID=UPI003CF7BF71
MLKIAIVIGSTRPHRNGEQVGQWVHQVATKRTDAEYTLVDLVDYPLPLLDEAMPPSFGQYANEHTREWAATIGQYDGYVFVTPEYNHSIPAGLKNAIDFLFAEWHNKAAGFVSYGVAGGVRAVEHLRGTLAEVKVATVRTQLVLGLHADFENYRTFKPTAHHEEVLGTVLDDVVSWSTALATIRN